MSTLYAQNSVRIFLKKSLQAHENHKKLFCVFRSCPFYESVLGSSGRCNKYMRGYRISSPPEAMIKNDAKVIELVDVAVNLAKEMYSSGVLSVSEIKRVLEG